MFILSVRLSVCPSVRLSVCPSVRLSVCPSVRLSVCLCCESKVGPFVGLPTSLSGHLVCLSFFLSVGLHYFLELNWCKVKNCKIELIFPTYSLNLFIFVSSKNPRAMRKAKMSQKEGTLRKQVPLYFISQKICFNIKLCKEGFFAFKVQLKLVMFSKCLRYFSL